MNKVSERCKKDSCAKFFYASKRLYKELKIVKLILYFLNIIPVIFCFLPSTDAQVKLLCSIIAFGLTLLQEFLNAFLNDHKEKAILSKQLYEAEITGSTFSKIEYDRESTNELNELAIRKGLATMKNLKEYRIVEVPDEITDDYSYMYVCRKSAAKTNYLCSRLFYFYAIILVCFACILISVSFSETPPSEFLYLLVCFWPLIIPLIRNCAACKKCMRQCVKICADIDNFFADGDSSVERLARFYFYVQNIEFEMLTVRPTQYKFFNNIFKSGVAVLEEGVTERFKEAILELKGKTLMSKGLIAQPKGKALITKVEYDVNEIEKKAKARKPKNSLNKNDVVESNDKNTKKVDKPAVKTSTSTKQQTKAPIKLKK